MTTKWQYIASDPKGPASCEIGDLCLFVSQISDCPLDRWVWTGDLPTDEGKDPRPAIFGIVGSRAEGMTEAKAAARRLHSGKLRIA